jgi:hypothetical protein
VRTKDLGLSSKELGVEKLGVRRENRTEDLGLSRKALGLRTEDFY